MYMETNSTSVTFLFHLQGSMECKMNKQINKRETLTINWKITETLRIQVFRDVTLCLWVNGSRRFEGK